MRIWTRWRRRWDWLRRNIVKPILTSFAYPVLMKRSVSSTGLALIAQLALVILAIPLLYAAPPAQGRILLVPVTAEARAGMAPLAIANGARLVAAGPWKGSLLVDGEGAALALPLIVRGIVPLAARIGGCGENAS